MTERATTSAIGSRWRRARTKGRFEDFGTGVEHSQRVKQVDRRLPPFW